jgi:hypothetical protein
VRPYSDPKRPCSCVRRRLRRITMATSATRMTTTAAAITIQIQVSIGLPLFVPPAGEFTWGYPLPATGNQGSDPP